MHQFFAVAALSLVGVGTGCVSSEKYNAQAMRANEAEQQLNSANTEAKTATATQQLTAQQAQQFKQMAEAKDALNANLTQENNELKLQLAEANRRHQEALSNLGKVGGSDLPVTLLSELSTLAAQNPETVEFDEKKGLVKFKSDVTFSVGSDIVKPEAQAVITRLAGILNGPVASQYELLVVGHTDNVPVSSEATKRAGHRDNWFLSAHRAIAVSKILQQHGTSARRIEVAGCADQRPIVPNDSEQNKARNRRVELFVLPTQISTPAPVAPSASSAVTAKGTGLKTSGTARKPLDKDTPTAPVETPKTQTGFNK
jgi:chemotaxis protein MotB